MARHDGDYNSPRETNALYANVNTVHILTLMVAFQDGSTHNTSPLKWGTIQNWGCAPGPGLKPSLNMMLWGEQMSTGNR